jgi:universal stress protein F
LAEVLLGIRLEREVLSMKTILVGLDASPRADGVLDEGIALARKLGAQLIVLRVCTVPVSLPTQLYAVSADMLPSVLVENTRQALVRQIERVPRELLAEACVELGTPWQRICDVAKSKNVDLILIGAYGYSLLDRMIGTTASRVVNHADRSVLVVRNHGLEEKEHGHVQV